MQSSLANSSVGLVELNFGVKPWYRYDKWWWQSTRQQGQDINPGGNQPAYGADKGLGAGDVLRFENADLYFGSTQLSSVELVTMRHKSKSVR